MVGPTQPVYLGIELGSTRIKACAVLADGRSVASGSSEWENKLVDGHWSYSLEEVWAGIQAAYSDLAVHYEEKTGHRPTSFAAMGVSAMMHGYLAFDSDGELLVPFRTWRDTYTGQAAKQLTDLFGRNVPLRWSIAHFFQAVLDNEEHVGDVAYLTTLAGYVHWKLTGEQVPGIGDAAGMFPVDSATGDYEAEMCTAFDAVAAESATVKPIKTLLPRVLRAGQQAGTLSAAGAALLDPSGDLHPGVPFCPPEGDAGTGMVATNAVRSRTGNVSVGTSIFAMVVLDKLSPEVHPEIDPVATPDGSPVAMVHCNNGTNELSAWMDLFAQVAVAFGAKQIDNMDDVYRVLLTEALAGDSDAGGLVAYNYLSGEPITGLAEGRPMVARGPQSSLSISNFLRAQVYAAFATLELGMRILRQDGVDIDVLYAHGGLFRTKGVGQRLLSAALDTPVGVAPSAAEGGSWGIALLARYLDSGAERPLADFLDEEIFPETDPEIVRPHQTDVRGFREFLTRYEKGLDLQRAAVAAIPLETGVPEA